MAKRPSKAPHGWIAELVRLGLAKPPKQPKKSKKSKASKSPRKDPKSPRSRPKSPKSHKPEKAPRKAPKASRSRSKRPVDILDPQALQAEIKRLKDDKHAIEHDLKIARAKLAKRDYDRANKEKRKSRKLRKENIALRKELENVLQGESVGHWSKEEKRRLRKEYGKEPVTIAESFVEWAKVFGDIPRCHINRDGTVDAVVLLHDSDMGEIAANDAWRMSLGSLGEGLWIRYVVRYRWNPDKVGSNQNYAQETKDIPTFWARTGQGLGLREIDARSAQMKIQDSMIEHYHAPVETRIQIHWNPYGTFPDRR